MKIKEKKRKEKKRKEKKRKEKKRKEKKEKKRKEKKRKEKKRKEKKRKETKRNEMKRENSNRSRHTEEVGEGPPARDHHQRPSSFEGHIELNIFMHQTDFFFFSSPCPSLIFINEIRNE